MTTRKIDFYFDFISPYSYLAATQMPAFAAEHGVEADWLPLNLPRLMKLSGNTSPAAVKNKAIYSLRDLKRWSLFLNVPFRMIRPGTFDSRPALRIAGALQGDERKTFCMDVFDALWSGEVDAKRSNWLEEIAEKRSFSDDWMGLTSEEFEANTHAALNAGAFGVPSLVLHADKGRDELFFGVDHMALISRAIRGQGDIIYR
ncbi:2-hydroxychromene-2-carboxylate isomerase [Mariprofundus ferrinatatus]|uniref:2-hydroxychromene-2-carboxylate isomerase n=1 Tax=Mariprofundus ferrinatatus TaxID=1921087 RepID=A0A2K8L9L3_9PROT|nr:DsbA family protein [Mariprofundus ferrinatatus]ATX80966.1 2-hydroxychromene-2-carboxylate isomerase [Mariprofundus ferrinatatus]